MNTVIERSSLPLSGRFTIPAGSGPEQIEAVIRNRIQQQKPLHTVSSSSTRDRMLRQKLAQDARLAVPPSPEPRVPYEESLPQRNQMLEPRPTVARAMVGVAPFRSGTQDARLSPQQSAIQQRDPRSIASSMEPSSPQLRSDMVMFQGQPIPVDMYRQLMQRYWDERR